jgi:hypothetical protein
MNEAIKSESGKEKKREATLNEVLSALERLDYRLEEILVWQKIHGASRVENY